MEMVDSVYSGNQDWGEKNWDPQTSENIFLKLRIDDHLLVADEIGKRERNQIYVDESIECPLIPSHRRSSSHGQKGVESPTMNPVVLGLLQEFYMLLDSFGIPSLEIIKSGPRRQVSADGLLPLRVRKIRVEVLDSFFRRCAPLSFSNTLPIFLFSLC